MQTSDFGKSKGLLKTLAEGTWSDAFDGLSISLLLTSNPAIQVSEAADYINGNFISCLCAFFLVTFHLKCLIWDQRGLISNYHLLQYTVFDQLKQRALKNKQNKDDKRVSPASLSAFMAFLLGAISKSIATCLTYPAIRCPIAPSNCFWLVNLVSRTLLRSFFCI